MVEARGLFKGRESRGQRQKARKSVKALEGDWRNGERLPQEDAAGSLGQQSCGGKPGAELVRLPPASQRSPLRLRSEAEKAKSETE